MRDSDFEEKRRQYELVEQFCERITKNPNGTLRGGVTPYDGIEAPAPYPKLRVIVIALAEQSAVHRQNANRAAPDIDGFHQPAGRGLRKLFVVGGAPRCGKSTTLGVFIERYRDNYGGPLATISTDDTREELWHEYEGRYDEYPDLLQQVIDNQGITEEEWIAVQEDIQYLIDRQYAQSRAVWDMRLGQQIHDHLTESGDTPLLAEGNALLPDLIAPLARLAMVRAVYLGNESPDHTEALIRTAHISEENWMHRLSDEQIRAYMQPKEAMSRRIRELAAAYDFPYINMGRGDFMANVHYAVDVLLES